MGTGSRISTCLCMVSCSFSSPRPIKQLLCRFVLLRIRQLFQGLEYIFSDSFWSLCQTLDEVGSSHTLLMAWPGGRFIDVPTGAPAAQGSSYWSRASRERERGNPIKNKSPNSA